MNVVGFLTSLPLASTGVTVAAGILGGVVGLLLGVLLPIKNVRLRKGLTSTANAKSARDVEYEELARKYPDVVRTVEEEFSARLPSLSGG